MGEQISFEHLIWNKVAQEASRAVILFPDVCDQHLQSGFQGDLETPTKTESRDKVRKQSSGCQTTSRFNERATTNVAFLSFSPNTNLSLNDRAVQPACTTKLFFKCYFQREEEDRFHPF